MRIKKIECKLLRTWGLQAALPALMLLLTAGGFAQTTTGNIVGTVMDASGSVVPGVTVTVTQQETNATRKVTTNADGQYTVTLLPVGHYTVEATHEGFMTASVKDILVEVNETARVDVTVRVGATKQLVSVTATATLMQTATSDVGAVISSEAVVELPLNGRFFMQMAELAPGTLPITHVDAIMAQTGNVVSNGADSNGNLITFDGLEGQDWLVPRVGLRLSPDALEEFKVMTGNFSSEYGRAAGANVNVVSKAGTNQYRGDVFEFLRNNDLDARPFSQPHALPPFRQNQFGGVFGGPVWKNKTFFFFSYEGYREAEGLTVSTIMPTASQRQGNLSGGNPIYDPLTTTMDPVTGLPTRQAFSGNIIPSNRLDGTVQKALNLLYPLPQTGNANVINAVFNPNQTESYNQYSIRVDHYASEKDRFWGRATWEHDPQLEPVNNSTGIPGQGTLYDNEYKNGVLGYTRAFSPNMVNDFRFGANSYYQGGEPQAHNINYVGEIGINGVLDDPSVWGVPTINVTGMSSVGDFPYFPSRPVTNDFEYLDTLSIIKGKHNIKIGGDIRRAQQDGRQFPYGRGQFNFNGHYSENPDVANPATTGQGLADFLLSNVSSNYVILGSTDNDIRDLDEGFFVNETWNARRDLTLNLGLRYDYLPQPISAKDRIVNYDAATNSIVTAQTNLNATPACSGCDGKTLAQLESAWTGIFNFETRTQAGLPRSLVRTDLDGFAPRVGMAWRIRGSNKTVLRAAYGRFYEVVAGNIQWNFSDQPPLSVTESYSFNTLQTPVASLANAFPSFGVQGIPGSGVSAANYRNPYNDVVNLTVERQLFPNTTLDVGYVGSRAHDLMTSVNFNAPQFGILSTQLLRPNPNSGDLTQDVTWGHSWYDSLQAKLQTRIRNSATLLISYTWANSLTEGGGGINQNLSSPRENWNFFGFRTPNLESTISPNDAYLSIDKGPSAMDVHQAFTASYVYDLPFGSGRKFGLAGPADLIAGGWEVSGITSFYSGFQDPVSYTGYQRPNLTCNPNSGAPHTIQEWFSTSCFSAPLTPQFVVANNLNPALAIGTAGRAPITGPGIQNWDLGIYKNFAFKEHYRVQFRAEMFNAFNHQNLSDPNTTWPLPTTGLITGITGNARQIQFGLKLYF